MNIFNGFSQGLNSYSKALSFISKHKLTYFFIFPIILNLLLLFFGFTFFEDLSDSLNEDLRDWIAAFDYSLINNEYVKYVFTFLLKLIFNISFFLAHIFFGAYIIVALMSPVFSILSEKCERIINDKDYPFSWGQFIKDIIRGVFLALRNALFELIIAIFLFFISFIPLLGFVTPVLLFLVSSYFYGFSFMDYSIERRRLGVKGSLKYMRDRRGLVIGNGFVFTALLLVPFVGVFLSAFASIVSVVAASILVAEQGE